jgi:hypothetical protein
VVCALHWQRASCFLLPRIRRPQRIIGALSHPAPIPLHSAALPTHNQKLLAHRVSLCLSAHLRVPYCSSSSTRSLPSELNSRGFSTNLSTGSFVPSHRAKKRSKVVIFPDPKSIPSIFSSSPSTRCSTRIDKARMVLRPLLDNIEAKYIDGRKIAHVDALSQVIRDPARSESDEGGGRVRNRSSQSL